MKKRISVLLIFIMILSMFSSSTVFAATKLTKRETAIVKAYVKTLETGNPDYLNKYASVKIKMDDTYEANDFELKFISAKYGKEYDKLGKVNCITVSGIIAIASENGLVLTKSKMAVSVVTKKKVIYAIGENVNLSKVYDYITIDNLTETQLKSLKSFLVKAFGEDKANKLMYPKESTIDVEDTENNELIETQETGSITSPIPVGETYTYNNTKDYLGDTLSGTYSFTVKGSKLLTNEEIVSLGFEAPDSEDLEYRLVKVQWQVKNAVLTKGTGSGDIYKKLILPDFWGCETLKGYYVIGLDYFGFDNSFDDGVKAVVDLTKAKSGEKINYTATGNIIVPTVKKDPDSYLVIRNSEISDYDNSKIHFKLTK